MASLNMAISAASGILTSDLGSALRMVTRIRMPNCRYTETRVPVNPNATARLHSAPRVLDQHRTNPRQPSASKRRRRPTNVVRCRRHPPSSMINDRYNGLNFLQKKNKKPNVRFETAPINEKEHHGKKTYTSNVKNDSKSMPQLVMRA